MPLSPFFAIGLLLTSPPQPEPTLSADAVARFANLALACVHKDYPYKIAHVLNSDADVAPPRELTPVFCGCYDWHPLCTDTGSWSGSPHTHRRTSCLA